MYLGIAGSYDCCFGTSLYELALTFQRLTSNCQHPLAALTNLMIGEKYLLA